MEAETKAVGPQAQAKHGYGGKLPEEQPQPRGRVSPAICTCTFNFLEMALCWHREQFGLPGVKW